MPYSPTTWVEGVTTLGPTNLNHIEQGIATYAPAYGTSLPGSPVDGQEAILVDSTTNPTYQWRFRYNNGSSSTYKWELVGGSPKVFNWDAGGAVMNNAAFTTASSQYWWVNAAGSVFPVPRSGDYNVRCRAFANTSSAQNIGISAVSVTSVPAVNAPTQGSAYVAAAVGYVSLFAAALFTVTTGTDSVGMAWTATTPGNVGLSGMWVEITPARVS